MLNPQADGLEVGRVLWIFTTAWAASAHSQSNDIQINMSVAKNVTNSPRNLGLIAASWRGYVTKFLTNKFTHLKAWVK